MLFFPCPWFSEGEEGRTRGLFEGPLIGNTRKKLGPENRLICGEFSGSVIFLNYCLNDLAGFEYTSLPFPLAGKFGV